jgi:Icc-related predicted phosphoesterase
VIRIAAIADVHFAAHSAGTMAPLVRPLNDEADLFLIAGDLTRLGDPEEARALAAELDEVSIPKVAIFGNHDYHQDREGSIRDVMEEHGVRMLDGEAVTIDVLGVSVGIAGIKGFGGGFKGACAADFGEPEMKGFVAIATEAAGRLQTALEELESDLRIALIHYSPIEATCRGERLEIYPFLGSHQLEDAVEEGGADVVFHGHAHNGSEFGRTTSGIPVYNVASTVIKSPYELVELEAGIPVEGEHGVTSKRH